LVRPMEGVIVLGSFSCEVNDNWLQCAKVVNFASMRINYGKNCLEVHVHSWFCFTYLGLLSWVHQMCPVVRFLMHTVQDITSVNDKQQDHLKASLFYTRSYGSLLIYNNFNCLCYNVAACRNHHIRLMS